MEFLILLSILISIEGLNIFLHVIGLSVLVFLYKREENDTQGIYLVNLAASELLWNCVAIAAEILYLLIGLDKSKSDLKSTYLSINIALGTGIDYNLILAMFYYTGDRLMHILLHARYEEYWNTKKPKY